MGERYQQIHDNLKKRETDKHKFAHPTMHHQQQLARLRSRSASKPHNKTTDSHYNTIATESTNEVYFSHATYSKYQPQSTPVITRPKSAGAFKPQKIEKTRFRYFYDRGDLPVHVSFAGAIRKLQWHVDLSQLDYTRYLPIFMEGLRELDEPYQFIARNGTIDLLEKGQERTLACLPLLILPMKHNLITRNPKVLCFQMQILQKLILNCPFAGETLVPYYRQLLAPFNLFVSKRVNFGDAIDYGQQRNDNIGDLTIQTLNLLERAGGENAFVNIKYMIPTYESCMTKY